jgi:hypothetical protein
MRGSDVAEADPVADGARRVLDAVEALSEDALFFQLAEVAVPGPKVRTILAAIRRL